MSTPGSQLPARSPSDWTNAFEGADISSSTTDDAPPILGAVQVVEKASPQPDYVRTEQGPFVGLLLFLTDVEDGVDRLESGETHFRGIRAGDLHVYSRRRNAQPHVSRWLQPLSFVNVMLRPSTLVDACLRHGVTYTEGRVPSLFPCQDAFLASLVRQLGRQIRTQRTPSTAYVHQLLDLTASHLITHFWQSSSPSSQSDAPPARGLPQDRLRDVIAFVESNLDRPLSVEDLASVACYSKHHFSRLFAQSMGESPYEYVVRRRLTVAARQLETSSRSVARVASSVGYRHRSHFSKAFKRHFGTPPSRYAGR